MKKSFNEFEFVLNGSKINFFIDGKECADYYLSNIILMKNIRLRYALRKLL